MTGIMEKFFAPKSVAVIGASASSGKPGNVVIEEGSGRPVVVDFGLLKLSPGQLQLGSIEEVAGHLDASH